MKQERKKKRNTRFGPWTGRVLMMAACILFLWSGYELYRIWRGYEMGKQEYDEIRNAVKQTAEQINPSDLQTASEPGSGNPDDRNDQTQTDFSREVISGLEGLDYAAYETEGNIMGLPGMPLVNLIAVRYNLVDFEKLRQLNPDVVAWITIEGTNIDYPVLYSPVSNDTYLRTTITGEFNNAGSIFVDYRVQHPFGSQNTLIHGHNQRNKMMFHELSYYVDEEFFNSHRQILIYLPSGKCSTYEIYSFYRTDKVSPTYDCSYAGREYQQYLDYSKKQSWYDTGVTLTMEDRIITLSTCTNDWDDERYVVHARKIS